MLENNPKLLSNDLAARHLRRKLKVRKQLRNRNVPIFDFDQVVRKVALKNSNLVTKPGMDPSHELKSDPLNQQILDRFQVSTNFLTQENESFVRVAKKRKVRITPNARPNFISNQELILLNLFTLDSIYNFNVSIKHFLL